MDLTWIVAEHLVSRPIIDMRRLSGAAVWAVWEGNSAGVVTWEIYTNAFKSLCLCLQLWRGLTWKLSCKIVAFTPCTLWQMAIPVFTNLVLLPYPYCVNCLSSFCILKKIICRHLHYDYDYYYYSLVLSCLLSFLPLVSFLMCDQTQTQLEHARIRELEQSLLFEKTQAAKLLRELEESRVIHPTTFAAPPHASQCLQIQLLAGYVDNSL